MHAALAAAIMELLLYVGKAYINSHLKVIQNGHLRWCEAPNPLPDRAPPENPPPLLVSLDLGGSGFLRQARIDRTVRSSGLPIVSSEEPSHGLPDSYSASHRSAVRRELPWSVCENEPRSPSVLKRFSVRSGQRGALSD